MKVISTDKGSMIAFSTPGQIAAKAQELLRLYCEAKYGKPEPWPLVELNHCDEIMMETWEGEE